jgi:hypothetical protein
VSEIGVWHCLDRVQRNDCWKRRGAIEEMPDPFGTGPRASAYSPSESCSAVGSGAAGTR